MCNMECSGCEQTSSCEIFYENFVLPEIQEEQRKEEYMEELKNATN